jgi:hypothetical protein
MRMAASGGESHRPDAAEALGDIPFEHLFQACRGGGDLAAWNDRFGPIVAQVAARVRAKFGDPDLAESAAQSAVATFLGRLREGEADSRLARVDGPDALFGYLVLRAHHKAWEKPRARWSAGPPPADWEPASPKPEGAESGGDEKLIQSAVRREMEAHLRVMLERMGLLLGTPRRRATFELMYQSMYGVERLTDVEIAQRVGLVTLADTTTPRTIKPADRA